MRRLFTAAALRVAALRGAVLALVLLALPAAALEVEDRIRLGPDAPEATLRILSTTDIAAARPFLDAFLAANPLLAVEYDVVSTVSAHRAIAEEGLDYDVVISSAMDLQVKLANDGFARPQEGLAALPGLPRWAHWRDLVFGFALEPVVILATADAFAPGRIPKTRREVIDRLREDPARFRNRIGTYDPAISGAGYLFATQDVANGNTFWRLAEVMGRLDARLYCCSGDMISDLVEGRLLIAYNVVGSYARTLPAVDSGLIVIEPEDFTLLLQRTAIVPTTAARPDLGAQLVAFLLAPAGQAAIAQTPGQTPVMGAGAAPMPYARAIRLDPGLLANLDGIRRSAFLREWQAAMVQP